MAAWSLSDKKWDALDNLRFSTTDAAVFRNATIILRSAVGRSSLARLNAHLLKDTGIGFSEDQLGRIVKQEGFSFQRP
jgi:hypothetical protein